MDGWLDGWSIHLCPIYHGTIMSRKIVYLYKSFEMKRKETEMQKGLKIDDTYSEIDKWPLDLLVNIANGPQIKRLKLKEMKTGIFFIIK